MPPRKGRTLKKAVMVKKEMNDCDVEPDIEDIIKPATPNNIQSGAQHDESIHAFDLKELRDIRMNLLEWYDEHRRKLPWRGDPPPYLTTATHTKQRNTTKEKKGTKATSKIMDAYLQTHKFLANTTGSVKTEEVVDKRNADAKTLPIITRQVSPYETWVSEIMLQQTRVDTVVEYFLRWTEKFPTVEALANASEEDVNALWAGLGYYRRARMLHAGAKYVMEHFNGQLPSTIDQLRTIPGIGPYTAGAISSIAFGNKEPLVDGNVIRVVARLRAVGADPKNKELIKFSWKSATEMVGDCDRPGALNQALMELGATVCSVQNPQCNQCPVKASCMAYEEANTGKKRETASHISEHSNCTICDIGRSLEWDETQKEVTKYPLKATKNESKNEVICVSVISYQEDGDTMSRSKALKPGEVSPSWKFLMSKRPEGGLLSGQWEFIHSKISDGDKIPSFTQRKKHNHSRLLELFGNDTLSNSSGPSLQRRDLGELRHIFSHVKHHMGIEHIHFNSMPAMTTTRQDLDLQSPVSASMSLSSIRWMNTEEMKQLGITTGVKKILALVAQSSSNSVVSITTQGRRKAPSSFSSTHVTDKASQPQAPKRLKSITSFFAK